MIPWIRLGIVLLFIVAQPVGLLAQFPSGKGFDPYAPVVGPRVRRARREQAVARVGPVARPLVEGYGDEAVAALLACSPQVGCKLAQFQDSGDLDKLPRPRALLAVIGEPNNGDDVALWAMQHHEELRDADSFDAYIRSPLDYALGLKQLAAGAAEVRALRQNQAAAPTTPWESLSANDRLGIAVSVGVLVIVGFLMWRRRNSGIC